MIEIDIEKKFVEIAAKDYGCWAPKFEIVGTKGAPDRIVFCPGGRVMFIEFKFKNNQPSEHQIKLKALLEKLGFVVEFCWSYEEAIKKLKEFLNE